jgi:photosystem II stability/assembly factor-like uncharacterized protein
MKKKSLSQSAPARRNLSEGGFFNLHVLAGLFMALTGVFVALLVLGFSPANSGFAQTHLSTTDSPEEEDPGARAAWERLRLQDEHGRIPPNALINAYEQKKAMSFHPEAWGEFLPGGATTQGIQEEIAGISRTIWSSIGPGNVGGRIRSIIIHPTIPGTIWVGSLGGGVWKTTNGGTSWSTTTDFMATLVVACMAIDPANPDVLYAGTGEGIGVSGIPGAALQGNGVFKTTDGGSNWTQLASTNNSNFYWVNRLAISPTNTRPSPCVTVQPQILLAATENGIFRSADGGGTWSQPLTGNGRFTDVRFDPCDGNKCIASDPFGRAYYSTNSGMTWAPATGFPGAGRIELAYAKSDPAIVYAQNGVLGQGNMNISKLFRSTDGGRTYALRNESCCGGGRAYNALWVDPTNANTLVAGGIDLWRSTDGGTSVTKISDYRRHPLNREFHDSVHCDHHVIVNHPNYGRNSNAIVYFGNDGGIYRTNNVLTVAQRSGWVPLNHDLGITQFYGAAGNPTSGTIIGGTQDNGTVRYRTQGRSNGWTMTMGADGGFCAADQTDRDYFYGESQRLKIYRSTDGGDTANYIHTGIDDAGNSANFIAPFVLDPNTSNTLLAGGASLWRSTNVKDSTPSWTIIKPASDRINRISAIAVAKGDSNIIWVGHNNGQIYYTTNGTAANPTWTPAANGLPRRFCTRITIDPQNSNLVYATFGGFEPGNVWKTTGYGAPWENISSRLPSAPVFSLVVSPSNSRALYIGTAVGIFASADGGATWSPGNDGPANAFVEELFWMGTQLVAATHGRGMFIAGPRPQPTPFPR